MNPVIHTTIMKDASELIHYDRPGVPLYIQTAKLSDYPHMRALCHWHEDIEFILVLKGEMYYDVGGKRTLLKEKDCIMVNAWQLHYGYSSNRQDCTFACVLFHPSLLTGSQALYQSFILPVLQNSGLEALYIPADGDGSHEITDLLLAVTAWKQQASFACELEIAGALNTLWGKLLNHYPALLNKDHEDPSSDSRLQKEMVSFIYQHYADKLSLADIAASGHMCRNKCCTIFKRYLQQSPIEFLNAYRLKVSCDLLTQTTDSVTAIACACGFNHLSYYSKLFMRSYGCTPSQYRERFFRFSY